MRREFSWWHIGGALFGHAAVDGAGWVWGLGVLAVAYVVAELLSEPRTLIE